MKVDKSTLTAKGSLVSASTANTPIELVVGTNGQILTADSTDPSGLKWATTTNTLTGNLASGIVSTINGVAATLTPSAGTIANTLGFDATGAIVKQAVVIPTMKSDEFTATANQTAFVLTSAPSGTVICFINGVRVPKAAFTFVSTAATYVPASNGSYTLKVGDRVNFDYI